jgi:hypothetical protein
MPRRSVSQISNLLLIGFLISGCGSGGGSNASNEAPPTLADEPQSIVVADGGNSVFTVIAKGSPAPSYQWRLNNQNLIDGVLISGKCAGASASGVTTASLNLKSVPLACDASVVTVQVTNSAGIVTSQPSSLSVVGYTTQPMGTSAFAGGTGVFSVVSNAPANVKFNWQLNGSDLTDGAQTSGACKGAVASGSTSKTLNLVSIPATCNGGIFTIKANIDGSPLLSQRAVLDVAALPALASATTVFAGGDASFAVDTNGSTSFQYSWSMNGQSLSDGLIQTGNCAGAIIGGVLTSSLTVKAVPLGCNGSVFKTTVTSTNSTVVASGSSTLNVSGFALQPLDAKVSSGSFATFAVTTGGVPAPSSMAWQMNGTALNNGYQASGNCAGAIVHGANSNALNLANIPLGCSGAAFSASMTSQVGVTISKSAKLNVSAGDSRNGTYKSFGLSGQLYDLSVDFNLNQYQTLSTGIISHGTLRDSLPTGLAPGNFEMQSDPVNGFSTSYGYFAYKNDVLVGQQVNAESTQGVFLAARNFIRRGTDFGLPVSFKVFGFDIVTFSAVQSYIYNGQVSASGFKLCESITPLETVSCTLSGGTLKSYSLAYNADGSVTFTNTLTSSDVETAYFAKMGSEILYLRAGTYSGGLSRRRIGIQSLAALNASSVLSWDGATFGTTSAGLTQLSSNRRDLFVGTPVSNPMATGRSVVLGSGLFSYGDDLLTPLYFAAQSSNLLVVAGLKSLSFPSVNNYLSIGLILP